MSETERGLHSICPECGKADVDEFDECPFCGWMNDMNQSFAPDMRGGENRMSLNEAKKAYSEGKPIE